MFGAISLLPLPAATVSTAERTQTPAAARSILWSLLVVGATSFGRNPSPYILKEFVQRRGWITAEEFAEAYALAKLLPGPTASNLVVYLAQLMSSGRVAALSLVPYVAPGAAVMLAASVFLLGHAWPAWFDSSLAGASAAVVGIFVAAATQMLPAARRSRQWLPVALASFLASAVLQANILVVLAVCGAVSVWLNRTGR